MCRLSSFAKSRKRAGALWAVLLALAPAAGLASPVRLWFSLSSDDPYRYDYSLPSAATPRTSELYVALGSTATLYLWGRPQTNNALATYDPVSNLFKQLQNLSLNLVVPETLPAIDVAAFTFENPNDEGLDRFGTVVDSLHTVTVNKQIPNAKRTYPNFTGSGVERIAAYTLTPPHSFTGIGPHCAGVEGCVDGAEPSWLLGAVDIDTVHLGDASVWLQVGSLSISHTGELAPSTWVRFGEDVVDYNVGGDRDVRLDSDLIPEIVLHVVDPLQGDYTNNGFVNAADYTVWRDHLGSTTHLAADGDGDGVIGPGDYSVWRATYGQPTSGSTAVPEPTGLVLALLIAIGLAPVVRQRRLVGVVAGVCLLLLAAPRNAQAVLVLANWTEITGGDWSEPSHWDTPAYPDNGIDTYEVTIGPLFVPPYTVTLDTSVTIDGLAVSDPEATLDILDSSLVVNNSLDAFVGALSMSGSMASLESLSGDTVLIQQSLLSQASTATLSAFGLENQGAIDVTSGSLSVFTTDVIQNNGTFNVGSGAQLYLLPATPYQHTGAAVLSGSGTFGVDSDASGSIDFFDSFTNDALVRPGASPGILTLEGNYIQTSSGVLEIEVTGLTAGTQHDRLEVDGAASLEGRLELVVDSFSPTAGDEVTILTTGGSVSGAFDYVHASGLSSTVAQKVVYNASDVRVSFLATTTPTFTATGNTVSWSTAFGGSAPDSTSVVTLFNNTPDGSPQTVVVSAPAVATAPNAAHSLTISDEITVEVDNTYLSVSTTTTIGLNGAIELTGTSLLATETLDIEGGGRFTGGGDIVGDVSVGSAGSGAAVFDPAGALRVDGDYTQAAIGRYAVSLFGTNVSGDFDSTHVTGDVDLGGELRVDLSALSDAEFTRGDVYSVLTTEGSLTGAFDSVTVTGRDDIYFDVEYVGGVGPAEGQAGAAASSNQPSINLSIEYKGDGNKDGVIDDIDAMIFSAMLLDNNFLTYDCGGSCNVNSVTVSLFSVFDLVDTSPGNERVVDFYDVPAFVNLLAQSEGLSYSEAYVAFAQAYVAVEQRLSVPEPGAAVIASFASMSVVVRRRR